MLYIMCIATFYRRNLYSDRLRYRNYNKESTLVKLLFLIKTPGIEQNRLIYYRFVEIIYNKIKTRCNCIS